jgi:hypothetical protein
MVALEDEETQKHGFIMIGCNMGPKRVVDRNAAFVVTKIRHILPMRVVTLHYLYDDFRMRPMLFIVMSLSKAYGRVRVRAHYGESSEVFLELSFVSPTTIALTLPNIACFLLKVHPRKIDLNSCPMVSLSTHCLSPMVQNAK